MLVKIFFVLFLLSKFAFSQSVQKLPSEMKTTLAENKQEKSGTPICGTPLITEEIILRAIENTRLYKPDVYESMQKMKLQQSLFKVSRDDVGAIRNFFVLNRQSQDFDEVTAELLAKGTLSQVWVDTTETANGHVTMTEVDAMLEALEDQTPSASRDPQKGIVELDVDFFGEQPNYDGDGITDFLITDIQDGWEPGAPSFVSGFFTNRDQSSGTGSNRRDILYVDSYPSIFFDDNRKLRVVLPTLAHELQHLIQHNFDQDELLFINEGFSHVAEAICGYGLISPSYHFSDTDVSLFRFNNSVSTDEFKDRSRGGLLLLYLNEQVGDAIFKQIVQEEANGDFGIAYVFSQQGVGYDFNQFFENFSLANYVNDKTFDSKFGYTYPVSGRPTGEFNHSDPNQDIRNQTVNSLAVDYIIYSFGDSLNITFNSASALNISAIKLGSGLTEIENVPTGINYSIPEFGNTIRTIVFAIINTGASPAFYSYNSTGKLTGIFAETVYDDGSADVFTGSAAFLGYPPNSVGWGWAVKFVPEVPKNTLVSSKILAAFDPEFNDAHAPADAPKDFIFHVWDSKNGLPGDDIISPFIVSTNRQSFAGEFLDIDLSSYESELTNHDTLYIGFTENDTVQTFVGMDSTTTDNYTYAFFSSTQQWHPMSDLLVNDVPLTGWNMMMRAAFSYVDNTSPEFVAGFFQNPIFSEQLDIFVVGSAKLSAENLKATFTQGSRITPLVMSAVPNTDCLVFVDDDVTLSTSGAISIEVEGTTKYGSLVNDSTFTFNVEFLSSVNGGLLSTTDGQLKLEIPENSLRKDMYLISSVGNSNVLNKEIDNSPTKRLSHIYTISPLGYNLNKPAGLKIQFDPLELGALSPEEITIAFWDSDKWVALESTLSNSENTISAEVSALGHFVIIGGSAVTDVYSHNPEMPTNFGLHQNYPNPFNPSTNIRIELPEESFTELFIYDLLGRSVRTLLMEDRSAGVFQITWDGRDDEGKLVNSGIYFYRVAAGDFTKTMKMILIK